MREKRTRKGVAFTLSDPVFVGGDDAVLPLYLLVGRSLGLPRDHGHPEVECLLSFTDEVGRHTVLDRVLSDIVYHGARYQPGDRLTIDLETYWETVTVEFREFRDGNGPYLRAVVLGCLEDCQALSSDEAYARIAALRRHSGA